MAQSPQTQQTQQPRAYVAVIRPEGYGLGIAVLGEKGFYPTNWHTVETLREAQFWAAEANKRLGLTPTLAFEIVASTMSA